MENLKLKRKILEKLHELSSTENRGIYFNKIIIDFKDEFSTVEIESQIFELYDESYIYVRDLTSEDKDDWKYYRKNDSDTNKFNFRKQDNTQINIHIDSPGVDFLNKTNSKEREDLLSEKDDKIKSLEKN